MTPEIRLKNLEIILAKLEQEGLDSYAKVGSKYDINPSFLSQLITGNRSLGEKAARNLEQKLGLEPCSLDYQENNQGFIIHGNNYNHGSQVGTQFGSNFLPVKEKPKFAPLISWVQAGDFSAVGDNSYDEYLPYFGEYGSNTLFWLEIKGDSMMPKFKQGDLVLINKDRIAQAGDYVVARRHDEDETTFKQYRPKGFDDNGREYALLIPLNDIYPHIDSRFQAFDIIGVAVEFTQKLV